MRVRAGAGRRQVVGGLLSVGAGLPVSGSTTSCAPATPCHADERARSADRRGRGREVARCAHRDDLDLPDRGRSHADLDPAGRADDVLELELRAGLRPPEGPEQEADRRCADRPGDDPDDGRRRAVEVEDLAGEQPARSEQRDEREDRRDDPAATHVVVDPDGIADPAEELTEHHRDEQEAATDEQAEQEDRVADIDLDHEHPPDDRTGQAQRARRQSVAGTLWQPPMAAASQPRARTSARARSAWARWNRSWPARSWKVSS